MEVSCQRHSPAALNPREWTPGTHCTGGWVGPRAGLDTEDRGKIFCPVVQSVVRQYTTGSQNVGRAPRGPFGEARVVLMRNILIWTKYGRKIKYILVGTLLGCNILLIS
jgi:hypothetical protein